MRIERRRADESGALHESAAPPKAAGTSQGATTRKSLIFGEDADVDLVR
jgi:hypothetical protein